MNIVYCKLSIPLLDELPGFWKKLGEFVGHYRIEPHSIDEWVNGQYIMISFHTDKVEFKEGERRQVDLEAQGSGESWNFTSINKA